VRTLLAVAAAGLLLAGCRAAQAPAPAGVSFLEVGPPRRLTDRPVLTPLAWSPDGQRVAYADTQSLWVATMDAKERQVAPAGTVTALDWSSTMNLLAYIDRGTLWLIRPDGTRKRRISLNPINESPVLLTHISWTQVGDKLVAGGRESRGHVGVWVLGADGGFMRNVFTSAAGRVLTALQWYPDALFLSIGISDEDEAARSRLLRWRINYLDRREVRLPFASVSHLRLSPNGRWVAFVAREAGNDQSEHVWVMRADGTGVRRVSTTGGRVTSVVWAPSSTAVAYARVLDDAHAEIWIAGVEGRRARRVVEFVAEFPDPHLPVVVSWSPDGNRLAYGTNSGSYTGPIWMVELRRR
jgi:Tol biopolymer transport system component